MLNIFVTMFCNQIGLSVSDEPQCANEAFPAAIANRYDESFANVESWSGI